MTGEVFTAWSLFTGGEEEGAGGCCRGWAATVRSQEGRRSSVLVSRRRSGVALQHNTGNTRYIYTLYLSSHPIHCLDILTTIYHCIFTMPMLPTTVPVYKCGPVSSARGNFPHCLRSRYPLSSLSLSSSSGRLQSHPSVGSPVLARWALATGHPCRQPSTPSLVH